MKNPFSTDFKNRLPLQIIFVVPFDRERVVTVGAIGYLSFINGQKSGGNIAGLSTIRETGNSHQNRDIF